jgi:hypothetical protein
MLVLPFQSKFSVSFILSCSEQHTQAPIHSKHLLVSLGEECYLSLPKGQLPITSSDDQKMKELFPVPGGGQLLIIPISHYPTLRSLPPDEAEGTLSEVNRYVTSGISIHFLTCLGTRLPFDPSTHPTLARLYFLKSPNAWFMEYMLRCTFFLFLNQSQNKK